MESTPIPKTIPSIFGRISSSSALYWIIFIVCYFGLHIVSYFLYRISAYYCKWNKAEKNLYQHFEDVVRFVVLTFLYVLAANYWDMFNCSIDHLILEYIIPFLISLFFAGFLCEVPYFRVSLVHINTWEMKTWIVFSFLLCVFLFLTVITFLSCKRKDLFFLPIIPCVLYFLGGLVVSFVSRHPTLKFHPRSYQIAFLLCLLRKEDNFYSRLYAAMCTGIFVRCVAANPMLSLLEPLEDDGIHTLSSRNSPAPGLIGSDVQIGIPEEAQVGVNHEDLNRPLLEEENEDLMLQTIERYNRGEIDSVTINMQTVNEAILEADDTEYLDPSFLHVSRSSDYGDWNEQQRSELYGGNK